MNFQAQVKQEEGPTAEQLTAERVINVHTTKPYEWVLENVLSEAQCGRRWVHYQRISTAHVRTDVYR